MRQSIKYLMLVIACIIVPMAAQADILVEQSTLMRTIDSSISAMRFASSGLDGISYTIVAAPVKSSGKLKTKSKSVMKAGLLSLLVPGAGEYYLGNKKKARFFFAAEAATWISFFSFRTYGAWKKDDYYRYAWDHASADLSHMDDQYHDLIGFYDNIDHFNTEGRIIEPSRPFVPDVPQNHWDWDSDANRETYRTLKNSSKEAYQRAKFMIGLAVLTRIVSVIDAVRDGRRLKSEILAGKEDNDRRRLKFTVSPFSNKNQVKLTLFTDL